MIRSAKEAILADYAGGLNTKGGPLTLAINETPACLNVQTNIFKSLLRRSGQSKVNAVALAKTQGNGLYDYAVNSTTHKLIGCFDDGIYAMTNLSGTWGSALKTGQTSSFYQFDNFVDNAGASHAIICDEGHDTPLTWDGSAGSTTTIAAMPAGSSPKVYMGYVFVNGLVTTPSRLQFSALADYTTWPAAQYYDEMTSDGEGFDGWAILKGVLYAFKPHSIFKLSYTGGSPLFSRRQVTQIGTIAPRTIKNCVIPGTGEVLVFLGPDASLYAFDGSDAVPISIKIETDNGIAPVSLGTVIKNTAILKNAWSENDTTNHQYVLNIANTGSASNKNNVVIAWDYYSNSFWPYDNYVFGSGCMMTDSNGQKQLIGAGYDGFTYKLNSGNNDSGSNVNAYWTSRKLDVKSYITLKKARELWVTGKTLGAYTLTAQYRTDWNTSWVNTENLTLNNGEYFLGTTFKLGTATLGGSEAVTQAFQVPNVNNLIQIKLSTNDTNPPWTVYQVDAPEDPLGIAKS